MERILVCITPQTNSHRLIDRAVEEAASIEAQLHILNIQKGDNIFNDEDSAVLLESLFYYGSKKGGIVHALAGEDVAGIIIDFIRKNKISKIVVGEPPKKLDKQKETGVFSRLERKLKGLEVIVVERTH